jgi:hypothetical protein
MWSKAIGGQTPSNFLRGNRPTVSNRHCYGPAIRRAQESESVILSYRRLRGKLLVARLAVIIPVQEDLPKPFESQVVETFANGG